MSSQEERDTTYTSVFNTNPNIMPLSEEFHPLVKVFSSIIMGLVFGVAIEKGRVFEPQIIRQQMVFQNFTMLKMFLSASATSMLVFSILTMIPVTRPRIIKAYNTFAEEIKYKSLLASAVGAFILGCGMTLAGACPGMVIGQLGAGVPNAGITLLGSFAGVLGYSILYPKLSGSIQLEKPIEAKRLDDYLHAPYFILALPVAACFGVVVFATEELFPWTNEVEQSGSGVFGSRSWPPFVAGSLLALNQIPAVTILQDTLGSSSGITTLLATLQNLTPFRLSYLRPYASGIKNWWQVFYLIAAILGSRLSAEASNSLATVSGVEPLCAFAGGFCMLFGARMAGGCTSGHGISGMSFHIIHSLVAVPAMFGGGVALGCLLKFGVKYEVY